MTCLPHTHSPHSQTRLGWLQSVQRLMPADQRLQAPSFTCRLGSQVGPDSSLHTPCTSDWADTFWQASPAVRLHSAQHIVPAQASSASSALHACRCVSQSSAHASLALIEAAVTGAITVASFCAKQHVQRLATDAPHSFQRTHHQHPLPLSRRQCSAVFLLALRAFILLSFISGTALCSICPPCVVSDQQQV